MILDLKRSFTKNIIVPYKLKDRTYYLLFFKEDLEGPFSVRSSDMCLSTIMHVGNLIQDSTDEEVGHIFYSQFNTVCYGTFLMSYSGIYKDSVNTKLPSSFEEIPCILKTPKLLVYHLDNKATIAMCPSLNKKIKANLEV
jgi:hypothetical protein